MRNLFLPSFIALGLVFSGTPAAAQEGNAEVGQELAQQWCSRCHDIGPEIQFKREPPGFAAIAVYRTQRQVLDHILAPHADMPELISVLDGDDLDDLIAYIMSLDPGAQ